MWLKMDGHEELVYLIAYPDGNLYGGGATCNPNSPPGTHGVHLHPAGLHIYGERQDGECFVYTNSGRGGARLVQSEVRLTKQEFKSLGQTKLWKDHLRPALLEESQRFDQWYLETRGSPNALSRFPLKMKTGSFVAKDANGKPVTIHTYTKYIRSKSQANHIIPGGQVLTTDDGYNVNFNVNRLEKGKYEIVPTGQILTSDDPSAP